MTSVVLVTLTLMAIALARRRPLLAFAVGAFMLGANLTSQVLKRWVLERPDLFADPERSSTFNSLPSGHTTVAATVAIAAVLVSSPRVRPYVGALAIAYATTIGTSVVIAGWHRPSDAFAALFVAGAWGAAAVGLLILSGHAVGGASTAGPVSALVGVVVVVAAIVVLGISWAVAAEVVRRLDDGPMTTRLETAAFAAAAAAILSVCVLVIASFVGGLRGVQLDRSAAQPEPARGPALATD